jgi:deazaflavin-dependent oxidoreductase (nitroreductase family)
MEITVPLGRQVTMTDASAVNDFNAQIIDEFRQNGGKVGGMFEKATLLLLHHKGAKSGVERISPLAYRRQGDAYAVFGSRGGAPTHPDWYFNLIANPRARVEVGSETIDVVARVTEGEERDRIWEATKLAMPPMAEYETKTDRQIPVVILDPA